MRPIGSYFDVDEHGLIVNPASLDRIQDEWMPAVERVAGEYLKHFGDHLHSVYVRGSVARGHAIKNVSDIDCFAVVESLRGRFDASWTRDFCKELLSEYPFIAGAEIGVVPLEGLMERRADRIMIKTQSVCVYGRSLAGEIPPLKPGRDTVQHAYSIGREVVRTIDWLRGEHTEEEVKGKCSWIMKRLLRSGFELVMERSRKYTRDLYPCYASFAEHYADKKDEMYRVLAMAIAPTANKAEIETVLNGVGAWLAEEVKSLPPQNDELHPRASARG